MKERELDRDLVGVYVGDQMNCIRVQLALEGHGVPAETEVLSLDERGVNARVYVDRVNLDQAVALVESLNGESDESREIVEHPERGDRAR
jgi:hypothetical protein